MDGWTWCGWAVRSYFAQRIWTDVLQMGFAWCTSAALLGEI